METEKDFRKKLIKQQKEFDKWENSIEGVLCDLHTWGDVMIEDEKNKIIIAKVLLKLPKRIRRKVLDDVLFVLMSVHGMYRGKIRFTKVLKKVKKLPFGGYSMGVEQPVIILNFGTMKRKSEAYKMSTVAHEVAHFILEHDGIKASNPSNERKADDLIEKWGFKRVYKSYEYFEKKRKSIE